MTSRPVRTSRTRGYHGDALRSRATSGGLRGDYFRSNIRSQSRGKKKRSGEHDHKRNGSYIHVSPHVSATRAAQPHALGRPWSKHRWHISTCQKIPTIKTRSLFKLLIEQFANDESVLYTYRPWVEVAAALARAWHKHSGLGSAPPPRQRPSPLAACSVGMSEKTRGLQQAIGGEGPDGPGNGKDKPESVAAPTAGLRTYLLAPAVSVLRRRPARPRRSVGGRPRRVGNPPA